MRASAMIASFGVLMTATPALAEPPTAQLLVAGTQGQWRGELQYRDYQSNQWMGLPVEVAVVAQPDHVTTVRTARFDDGPKTGIVTITTVSLIDPTVATENYASFRAGRAVDTGSAHIDRVEAGTDLDHWTIVTTEKRIDGNSMAQVRETTTRDGDQLMTLKEVNPDDDGKDIWLPRNRTVLTRVTGAATAR